MLRKMHRLTAYATGLRRYTETMKNFTTFLLCASLIFLSGFMSCEHQLTELIPTDPEHPAGMVRIPAGEVTLGAPEGDIEPQYLRKPEYRERTVFVDAFYIDTHEVTIAEYKAFVEETGFKGSGYNWWNESDPKNPVFAAYDAARAYAEWAGKRLPTPDEWEKAARGGLVGKRYPWGSDTPTEAHARIKRRNQPRPYVVPVGSYPPNGYGLYDMAGNLAEWVAGDFEHYGVTSAFVRGGSWHDSDWYLRNYTHDIVATFQHGYIAGFRCAADVPD